MLVTIKNGKRTLKLTKRERDALETAASMLIDIARDFVDPEAIEMRDDLTTAIAVIAEIDGHAAASETTPKEPALAGK